VKNFPEYWSVSLVLRHLGDRWSLLIVRELLFGERGFNELARSLPDLSRNLLSQRLKKMVDLGIITRSDSHKLRGSYSYKLTSSGFGLADVLKSIGLWATHWQSPFEHDLKVGVHALLDNMSRTINTSVLPKRDISICFNFESDKANPLRGWILGREGSYSAQLNEPSRNSDLKVEVNPQTLYELWWGIQKCEVAKKTGDIGFEGPAGWGEQMSSWFLAAK
jgi:DNA-binding HxlR family transcriptional regulator